VRGEAAASAARVVGAPFVMGHHGGPVVGARVADVHQASVVEGDVALEHGGRPAIRELKEQLMAGF
jgi:hypothetical protein